MGERVLLDLVYAPEVGRRAVVVVVKVERA